MERSVHAYKCKGKWKLIKRQPLKSELKRREVITDARRTYAQLLLNAINSCDTAKLTSVFNQYCTADVTMLSLYAGADSNPSGANCAEFMNLDNHIFFWCQYFSSVPDLVFESEFVTAYTDKTANMTVVKSKYRMSGTRIIDMKLATAVTKQPKREDQVMLLRNSFGMNSILLL